VCARVLLVIRVGHSLCLSSRVLFVSTVTKLTVQGQKLNVYLALAQGTFVRPLIGTWSRFPPDEINFHDSGKQQENDLSEFQFGLASLFLFVMFL